MRSSQFTKTIHDRLGRQTHRFILTNDDDDVEAYPAGFDAAVQRIASTYELGRVDQVNQYDAPSGGTVTDGV